MSDRVLVRPFSHRGFCPFCQSTRVGREHHAPLRVLLVTCADCGARAAQETAEAPKPSRHQVPRTIMLPSREGEAS